MDVNFHFIIIQQPFTIIEMKMNLKNIKNNTAANRWSAAVGAFGGATGNPFPLPDPPDFVLPAVRFENMSLPSLRALAASPYKEFSITRNTGI